MVLSSPSGPTTDGSTTGPGSSGRMAIMGTDPYASNGASQEYEHYNNVAAHRTQSGGQATSSTTSTSQGSSGAGWVLLNATATLKLSTLVNASQTLALANIRAVPTTPSGFTSTLPP